MNEIINELKILEMQMRLISEKVDYYEKKMADIIRRLELEKISEKNSPENDGWKPFNEKIKNIPQPQPQPFWLRSTFTFS